MPKLHELKERRSQKVATMQGLLSTAESAGRDLNDIESQNFDSLKAEVRSLDSQIERAETVAELERRADAAPVHEGGGFEQLEQRVNLLSMLRAATEGRPLQGVEAEYNREVERRNGRPAQGFYYPIRALETRVRGADLERRVNLTTTLPEVIPTDVRADEFIPLFRRRLIVRRLGARTLIGLRGDVSIPRGKTGIGVGWVSENEALPEGNLDLDAVTLTPRHAGAVTELSRQLILQASPDAEQLVRDDMSAALAEAIDAAAISGDGIKQPLGVMNASGVNAGTLAGPTFAQVLAMMAQVDDREPLGEPSWVLGTKGSRVLRGTVKTAANVSFLAEGGMLGERPAIASGKVGEGVGVGTAIYGDWSQILIGVWSEIDVLVNPFAEVPYRRGGVLVRAMTTVDVGIRAPQMFSVAEDVPAA